MHEPALSTPTGDPLVRITGTQGTFIVQLDPDASFESLRQELRRVLTIEGDRYRGASVRLDLGSRPIALFDVRRLVSLLKDECHAVVTAIYCTRSSLLRYAEHELKLKVIVKDPAPEAPIHRDGPSETDARDAGHTTLADATTMTQAIDNPVGGGVDATVVAPAGAHDDELGRRLMIVDRTLRGGAHVRFAGDVVVYGDVNAGAQVVAGGNILVLGALRGLAHAGAQGDEQSVIISFDLRPTQLRIGSKIAVPPGDSPPPKAYTPEIAWVNGATISIESYSGRLPFNQNG